MKTPNTVNFCDKIKELYKLETNYQLFKMTKWSQTSIGNYYKKGQSFSDAHAIQAADLLNLDAGYVMACVHAERSKTENVKNEWLKIAALLVPDVVKNKDCILCKIAENTKNQIFAQYPLDLQHFPSNVTRLNTATKCRDDTPQTQQKTA